MLVVVPVVMVVVAVNSVARCIYCLLDYVQYAHAHTVTQALTYAGKLNHRRDIRHANQPTISQGVENAGTYTYHHSEMFGPRDWLSRSRHTCMI